MRSMWATFCVAGALVLGQAAGARGATVEWTWTGVVSGLDEDWTVPPPAGDPPLPDYIAIGAPIRVSVVFDTGLENVCEGTPGSGLFISEVAASLDLGSHRFSGNGAGFEVNFPGICTPSDPTVDAGATLRLFDWNRVDPPDPPSGYGSTFEPEQVLTYMMFPDWNSLPEAPLSVGDILVDLYGGDLSVRTTSFSARVVPEPVVLSLLAVGFAGAWLHRRRI